MTRQNPQRETILSDFVKTQFVASSGMMNRHFITALTCDLRLLSREIAAFASESPAVEDGDGADYSGGYFETPVGQRYHIAREITALWSEKDPETLSRMWIAFVASHPDAFQESETPSAIRRLAAHHIHALAAAKRKSEIASILAEFPAQNRYADTKTWLESLAE